MSSTTATLGRGQRIALTIALVWAAALPLMAFVAPVYQWESRDSTGAVTRGSDTLVGVNGAHGVVAAAVPLVLTIATVLALWLRGRRRGAGPAAWTLTSLSAIFSTLAILSVGPFVLPVVGCLIYACAAHGRAVP